MTTNSEMTEVDTDVLATVKNIIADPIKARVVGKAVAALGRDLVDGINGMIQNQDMLLDECAKEVLQLLCEACGVAVDKQPIPSYCVLLPGCGDEPAEVVTNYILALDASVSRAVARGAVATAIPFGQLMDSIGNTALSGLGRHVTSTAAGRRTLADCLLSMFVRQPMTRKLIHEELACAIEAGVRIS